MDPTHFTSWFPKKTEARKQVDFFSHRILVSLKLIQLFKKKKKVVNSFRAEVTAYPSFSVEDFPEFLASCSPPNTT